MGNLDYFQIFALSSTLSIIIPAIVGLLMLRRVENYWKLLVGFLVVATIVDFSAAAMALKGKPNLWLLLPYTFLEATALGGVYWWFYYSREKMFEMKLVLGIVVAVLIGLIVDAIFGQGLNSFNSLSRTFEALGMIILSLIYFFSSFQDLSLLKEENIPMLWFNSGVLLYFATNVFVFLLSDYILSTQPELHIGIWAFHSVANILFNLLTTVTIWFASRQ